MPKMLQLMGLFPRTGLRVKVSRQIISKMELLRLMKEQVDRAAIEASRAMSCLCRIRTVCSLSMAPRERQQASLVIGFKCVRSVLAFRNFQLTLAM